MNETARILCAISDNKDTEVVDILVNAGVTLLPTYEQIAKLKPILETFAETELITLKRTNGDIKAVRLTPLGSERAREAMEGASQ